MRTRLFIIAAGLAFAPAALAQQGLSARVVTDETGAYIVNEAGPADDAGGPSNRDIIWDYFDQIAIPQSVAFSTASASVWVGQTLNSERFQRFAVPGTGTPSFELPAGPESPTIVHAAEGVDRAMLLDRQGAAFTLAAYSSAGAAQWTHTFPANFTGAGSQSTKVSRDGSIAACVLHDGTANVYTVHIFDGATGDLLRTFEHAGFASAVDLTDDGALCLVTEGSTARLIDTSNATEIFSAPGSGAGGWFQISGNGDTIVIGGFSLYVYHDSGSGYAQVINYTSPSSWFGWASAVSRDGLTVGVLSHDYASGYLNTSTRIFDVPSATLLGEHHTFGSGGFQGSASAGAMSDDGGVLAVAHWGTQDNAAPEVMIFDRNVNLIGSIDTFGSVFSLDLSADGSYVIAGSKNAHANSFGNGGYSTLYQVSAQCRADLDFSGDLTLNDFVTFRNYYTAGDLRADFDGNGSLTLNDFVTFRNEYTAGCQ